MLELACSLMKRNKQVKLKMLYKLERLLIVNNRILEISIKQKGLQYDYMSILE